MEAPFIILLIMLAARLLQTQQRSQRTRMRPVGQYRRLKKLLVFDVPPVEPGAGPSFYRRIEEQLEREPSELIDYEAFPPMPAEEPGSFYYPGARDTFTSRTGETDSRAWETIVAAVLAVRRKRITDWRVLERNVASIDPVTEIDRVLQHLTYDDVTYRVRALFREMARQSTDYCAVKWGAIIGTIGADPHRLHDLLTLARHSEFTVYVAAGLAREAGRANGNSTLLRSEIAGLLSTTEGWGLYQAIRRVRAEPALRDRDDLRRTALVAGMRSGASARPQIAGELLAFVDLHRRIEEASEDADVAEALLELVTDVVGERREFAMSQRDELELIRNMLRLVEVLPASIESLRAIHTIGVTLSREMPAPESAPEATEETGTPVRTGSQETAAPDDEEDEREELLGRTRQIFLLKLSREIISEAIVNDHHKLAALEIATEAGIRDVLPEILDDFRAAPNPANVQALGVLGNQRHLVEMFHALPRIARRREGSPAAVKADFSVATITYGVILRHIGAITTSNATAVIYGAAHDPNPFVRSCAMNALERRQRWTLDRTLKLAVRHCLADPSEMVRDAAERTAAFHTLFASINRATTTLPMEDLGLSRN